MENLVEVETTQELDGSVDTIARFEAQRPDMNVHALDKRFGVHWYRLIVV